MVSAGQALPTAVLVVNIATVFRCVSALARDGMIRAVEAPRETTRYERADTPASRPVAPCREICSSAVRSM